MCTLLFLGNPAGPGTLALLANRDESRERSFEAPRVARVGARDALFPADHLGGTWLGTNADLLVAVTNAPSLEPDPERRSRGLLVRDALAAESAAEAETLVREALGDEPYNGFNLLLADAHDARVLTAADGETTTVKLASQAAHLLHDRVAGPGHVLEQGLALGDFAPQQAWLDDPEQTLRKLGSRFLGGHEPLAWTRRPACRHGEDRGTVSSTLVYLDATRPAAGRLLFAPGLPCEASWESFSLSELRID